MKITDLSILCKWENMKNRQCIKYLFAPLYILYTVYIYIYIYIHIHIYIYIYIYIHTYSSQHLKWIKTFHQNLSSKLS